MLAKAEGKYIRIQSRKVRLVTDLVKGKTVEEAGYILNEINKSAAEPIAKVLNSAFANLNNNRQDKLLGNDVFISKITANEGPMLVRYRAATMGRASSIRHRTAHIYIELDKVHKAKEPVKTKKKKKTESK